MEYIREQNGGKMLGKNLCPAPELTFQWRWMAGLTNQLVGKGMVSTREQSRVGVGAWDVGPGRVGISKQPRMCVPGQNGGPFQGIS